MEQKRPADIIQELLDYLWNGLGLEEKGWKRLKKGDFKKKMKNGLTYQIWFDRSRYNYIDYEIGHGNVEVGFSCIIKQGDDYLYYYVVNPYALEWKNDHYYLIGFSLKHQKIAHFRVDRLTSVENLETYFMPIEGFDVASYTNKMVDMFTSESSKEVTLLCENELMRVIIDHYGEDAAVDRYDDTHFTAKIEVNPSGTFYGWIFKFKGKIKILSPKECITEMQQIAQEFI